MQWRNEGTSTATQNYVLSEVSDNSHTYITLCDKFLTISHALPFVTRLADQPREQIAYQAQIPMAECSNTWIR